jgi:hypothetical protein
LVTLERATDTLNLALLLLHLLLSLPYLTIFGSLELVALVSSKNRRRCRWNNLLTVLSRNLSERINKVEVSGRVHVSIPLRLCLEWTQERCEYNKERRK